MKKEGWSSGLGNKDHYMRERRSLCRRWMWIASEDLLTPDDGKEREYDCKTCRRILKKNPPA